MSKNLKQLDLLDRPCPHVEEVSITTIKRRPTLLRAWHLAVEVSGLEDKQVYAPLNIDASHWTRIKNGSAFPPADERFVRFMDLVGNEIPLIWLVEARGYDWTTIRKHRSADQRRIADLEAENRELRRAMGLWLEVSKGRA